MYLLCKYKEERLFFYLLFVVEELASFIYGEGRRSLLLKEKEYMGKESYSSLYGERHSLLLIVKESLLH